MIGALPTSLDVNGKKYNIRSDYRNILRIFEIFNAPELTDQDKILLMLRRMYVNFESIPRDDIQEAYHAAIKFIECDSRSSGDKKSPKLVDWNHDEQLIFAEVNKVAGKEIRMVEYLHWWSFLGLFQCIDNDGVWGLILTIRQKKAKHKQLERHEKEFYNANQAMCDLPGVARNRKAEIDDFAKELYAMLSDSE